MTSKTDQGLRAAEAGKSLNCLGHFRSALGDRGRILFHAYPQRRASGREMLLGPHPLSVQGIKGMPGFRRGREEVDAWERGHRAR